MSLSIGQIHSMKESEEMRGEMKGHASQGLQRMTS